MKKVKPFLLLLLILISMSLAANAQTKYALIFAIGDYPTTSGWSKISSATDVNYIKTTLNKQGFDDKNIKITADAAATKQGILNAMDELVKKVRKDDIVVIHFSSHGQQVADNDLDESDGYDETIVPYNATLPPRGEKLSEDDFKKMQANYFRDDEFGLKIEQLRGALKGNGDIIVFIDACHSGSGTRGVAKVRGGQPALAPAGYNPIKNKEESAGVFREGKASRGDEGSLATYVVFSAALAEELNYETTSENNEDMGSLTYAVSKAFANLDASTTYRSLFAKVQSVMNEKVPGQHPVIEGNGLDRMIFGGKFVHQKPYIEVEGINNPKEFTLKAGLFAGLDSGAKIAVYPSGTNDPSKASPLSRGTIIKSGNYSAIVSLEKVTGISQPASMWVFVTDPVYRIKPVRIGFSAASRGEKSAIFSDSEALAIRSALKTLPLVTFSGTPDLVITKGIQVDSIKIADNGYLFSTVKDAATNTAALKQEVNRFAQYRFLQSLNIGDSSSVNAQVKLLPLINGKPDTSFIKSNFATRLNEFKVGDKLVLWVKNTSDEATYVNILDIQPDGRINPILPNAKQKIYPRDLRIEPGASKVFDKYIITLTPPLGMEIFKVFVSTDEINMEGLADPSSASRSTLKVFESLVQKSSDLATRGGDGLNVGNGEGSSYNLLFRIKDK